MSPEKLPPPPHLQLLRRQCQKHFNAKLAGGSYPPYNREQMVRMKKAGKKVGLERQMKEGYIGWLLKRGPDQINQDLG